MEQKINMFQKNNLKTSLSEFRLEKVKQQQTLNLSQAIVSYYKNQCSDSEKRNIIIQDEISRSLCLKKLSSWAKDIPVEGLLPEWEKNIKKSVLKLFKKKYDRFLSVLIDEIKQIYLEEMQKFALQTVLAIKPDEKKSYEFLPEQRDFLSINSKSFLKNRSSLSKKYSLSHCMVRFIIKTAFFNLPKLFINLSDYRSLGILNLSEFEMKIKKDIKKASLKILSQYYNLIIKALPALNVLKNITSNELPRVIHCATVIFAQQILNIKMNTITHLINSIKDSLSCPLLNLDLIFEKNKLSLKPNVKEICYTFHEIINNVSIIAEDLVPFENYFKIKTNQDFIKVKLPDWFLQQSHNNLKEVLENIFQSLNEYHFNINEKFKLICESQTKENVLQLVSEDREFEEYCSQAKIYLTYRSEVNAMVSKFYYDTGIVNQSFAKDILKSRTLELINILIKFLTESHLEEAQCICSEFETLKTRALNIPKDANSLFELSEYMSHGAKDLVSNLEKKVIRSIQTLGSLLEITILSDNHIDLNKQNINWIESIKPIFIQSNTLSEAMKSESEDELQRRITILNLEIDELIPEFVILDDMDDAKRGQEYMEYLKALVRKMNGIEKKIHQINFEERLFKFPETSFPKDTELRDVIEPFFALVRFICEWERGNEVWLKGPFEYLDADLIERKTKYFFEEISESNKTFKSKIKMDVTSNKAYKFSGIVDDPDPMQQPAPLKLCWQVLKDINNFLTFVPLAICFCNPALRKRHWDEMSAVSGENLLPNAGTTLKKIIDLNLMSHIEIFQVISTGANKELALQNQVENMFKKWESISFQICECDEIFNFVESEAIEILLDDHFSKIHDIRGSYFVKPAELRVLELFEDLTRIQIFIQQWQYLQFHTKKFLPLFSNCRAANQLPEEEILFSSIKRALDQIKEIIYLNSTFKQVGKNEELIRNLEVNNSKMQIIEKSIQIYLEKRRFDFPKFFFISDDEVLKILFNQEEPSVLGLSLTKCFPGVKNFGITKSFKIKSLFGDFGEKIKFINSVSIMKSDESVTNWLNELEAEIHRTLKEELFVACNNFDFKSCLVNYPGMITYCSWQIYWTTQVQNCFKPFDIEKLKIFQTKEQELILEKLDQLKSSPSRLKRKILSSVISLQMYQKDITELLITKNVTAETDFDWKAQLRYYSKDKSVQVEMMNASINYGFEYNNQFSIVNTPLTERCYRTLMEAYYYNYFGSIIGPSDSGKTETVRSLAKAVALLFYVYNGNEKLSFDFIDNILKGLVACGAWICFKNFDQIEEGTLSIISQRIVSISKSRETGIVDFDGTFINFNQSGFISIIMNPESSEKFYSLKKFYVPETIKYRFRTVAMILPDINRICEVELFAAGFKKSEILALKIKTVYHFCSELLKNYYFGLRNVKLILKIAICLKEQFPDEEENVLILRALIDVNMPKFNQLQIPIFKGILEDIFPGVLLPNPNYEKLLEAFEEICRKNCLNSNASFKLKVIQIFEMIYARDGIIIIGDPLAGKSTVLKTLTEILNSLEEHVELENINPGAISIDHLYGYFNEKCEKWKDGIFLKIFRSFLKSKSPSKKWIIFDGPIHVWIENLHSLLDDNKTLILNSHEKLSKPPEMKVFIETLDLHQISPLTISRFGIINIQSEDWRNYIKPLIKNLEIKNLENYEILVYSLFDWTIDTSIKFIDKNCKTIVKVNKIQLVMSTFNLFRILLTETLAENSFEKGKQEYLMAWVQAIFIISTTWALAGTLDLNSLKLFNSFYLSLWNTSLENRPNSLKPIEMSFPTEGLLTDYVYVFKGTGNWKHCSDLMKNEKILENPGCKETFIPTVDSIKYSMIFQKHINYKRPFLLCSNNTSGKTSLLQDLFANKLPETFSTNSFNFTSRMTGKKAQRLFLSKLIKRKRGDYGPLKQCCINFVDNLNCDYFTDNHSDSALELIRQFFDYGFWYDLENSNKISIHDTTFVIEMNKINSNICRRFLRHFIIYVMHDPGKESIFKVFSNVLFLNLKKNSFAMDVMPSLNGIVNATIEFYFSIKENLRPVPDKLQYIFSLKDISKIIRGCSIVHKESVETKITFIRLWVHEVFRVFGDRIIEENDQTWFFSKLKDCVKSNFKDSFESAFDNLPKTKHDELTRESFRFLHFGNFMDEKSVERNCDLRKYEEINSMEILHNKVNSFINEYNVEHKIKLDVAISNFILEHLVRVCRIMSIPGENLLLVCSSGFGRKSLIRLASYMEKQNLYEPNLDFYYNLEAWRRDLKSLLKNCASGSEDYSILIRDRDLKNEFLDDVISLVETGQLPELFSNDDEREIIKKVRLAAQNGNRNLELTISEVLEYFTKECKKKLHFIICLSPFHFSKLGKNISLLKSCTLNFLLSWPKEAFEKVAIKFLKEITIKEEIKSEIITTIRFVHNDVEEKILENLKIKISPSIFIRFAKLYSKTILTKQKELKVAKRKYMNCLEKLKLAADQVDQMKKVLMTLRPQLESSAEQTRIKMEEVENENLAVEKATIIVKDEEKIANEKAEIAGQLRTECETDLAVAIPILEDAISALNTLKPADITLVKAMKNPPDTVKLVMAAVCVMLDVPSEKILNPVTGKKSSDYWGPSKRVLGDMNFLQNLKDYDKDNISISIMQMIKSTYMTDKSFLPHIVAKASSAAEGLCKWVRAMVSYDEVAKAVAPKKEKLALAQKECDDAEAYLNEKRETLTDLNERLAALKTSLETVLAKKMELEKEVADCTDRLEKAESLLKSLGGEKSRWICCTDNLQTSFNSLAGDILLACGLVIYLASYNLEQRDSILNDWKIYVKDRRIPCSEEFQFTKILGSENQFYSWYLSGLAANPFIHQNAVIMNNSDNWCLFIDPQNQAKKWIKNLEKDNDLKIIKSYDKNCIDVIRNGIILGKPILMENFENLIASLDPVFLQSIYSESDQSYIEIRKEKIVYSRNFRFYVTTGIKCPKLSTDIFNRVTLVNFSFPEEALTENLLDIVISKENYQIQDNYENLKSQLSHGKMALNKEEEKVLDILSISNVNILEDRKALKILDSSKHTSIEIIKQEKSWIQMKEKIELFREGYRDFAKYSARLYSIINSLSNLNQMYIYSLSWFFQLYIKAIESSKRSVILEKRLSFLKYQVMKKIHLSVKNSLLEKDKLIFSFVLCLKMLQVEGNISEEEINAFWKIEISPETVSSEWKPEKFQQEISKINQSLGENYLKNLTEWKNYFQNPRKSVPKNQNLTEFQKLIIMKVIRPDRILISISNFIEIILGNLESKNKVQTTCDISLAFDESTCLNPLIFILPSHVTLFPILLKFAKQKRFSSKLLSLSMNENQGEKAEYLIKDAQKDEKWVFLENCHLAPSWLSKLEKIIDNFDASNTALGFRLWLSTFPSDKFPPSIFHSGIKISCDAPIGLKENLLWIYNSEPVNEKKFFDGCPGKDKTFSKLLYGLSFFHVILKERKNYGHRGWNISYDFNDSDFCLSATQLQYLINVNKEVPFKTFLYLIQECSYGSKVSSEVDRKRLGVFIEDFCNLQIAKDPFYSFFNEPGFLMPRRHEYNDYIQQIMEIRNDCDPEFFGLDESGEIIKNLRDVQNFMHSFNCINEIIFEEKSEEERVRGVISGIREKLRTTFDMDDIEDKYPVTFKEPLHGILIQEIEICNSILIFIENSFLNIENAYDGISLWKTEFDNLTKNFICNLVPESWKIKFNITMISISSFIENLRERINFLENWINNGNPKSFCLGFLNSSKGLLTAIQIIFARSKNLLIEEINFYFEITSVFEISTTFDSVDFQLYGLFLLGGRWDVNNKVLKNNFPKMMWYQMPVIHLKPKTEKMSYINRYECPLYNVPHQVNSRNYVEDEENFIINIPLSTKTHYNYWIKKGTALYCRKE